MMILFDIGLRWPQRLGIAVGGIVGAGAAIQTGDLFRYVVTAVYLGITAPLYVWKFFLAKRSSS